MEESRATKRQLFFICMVLLSITAMSLFSSRGVTWYTWNGQGHNDSTRVIPEVQAICDRDMQQETEVARHLAERKQHMQAMCANYTSHHNRSLSSGDFNYFLVDDRNHVIYCFVPKVGCTNWKRMMVHMTGKYHGHSRHIHVHVPGTMHKFGIRKLSNYKYNDIMWRLSHYKTFMFARNPFERVLSAYRNKFLEKDQSFLRVYAPRIKRMFRGNAEGGPVQFQEFVRYLIRLDKNKHYFNQHWRPMHKLCHPCQVDFDFIGKMETMTEDSDYVLRHHYKRECPPKFPQKIGGHKTTNHVTSLRYANLTSELVDGLRHVFEADFDLFDYDKMPPNA